MIKVCKQCGKEFIGFKLTNYCTPCLREIQRKAAKEYYYKNREKIRKQQKVYQMSLEKGEKTREKPKYDTRGWKIEYIRNGDLWTWKAQKGKYLLKAEQNFEYLIEAQKDCLLAIG